MHANICLCVCLSRCAFCVLRSLHNLLLTHKNSCMHAYICLFYYIQVMMRQQQQYFPSPTKETRGTATKPADKSHKSHTAMTSSKRGGAKTPVRKKRDWNASKKVARALSRTPLRTSISHRYNAGTGDSHNHKAATNNETTTRKHSHSGDGRRGVSATGNHSNAGSHRASAPSSTPSSALVSASGRSVFSPISKKQFQQKHFISYRDCTLTHLLHDSLNRHSKTVLIACVSPKRYGLSTLKLYVCS